MARSRKLTLGLITILASSNLAMAQLGGVAESTEGKMDPPTPSFKTEEGGETGAIFSAVILMALAAGVNLIPTKRGHQD